jgi:hypothetical protein
MPSPELGRGYATARVHHADRRRGCCVAAPSPRAATRADAAHRRPHRCCGRTDCPSTRHGVHKGATGTGVDRRPQHASGLSLGRGRRRHHSPASDRVGRARTGRHSGHWRPGQRIGDQGIHSDDFCLRSFRKPLNKGSRPCLVSWKKSLSGSDRGRSNPVACYQIRRQSSCDSEADDARSTALGRGLEGGGEALALTADDGYAGA